MNLAAQISEKTAAAYDQMPYHSHAFLRTYPSRLAAIARLFGLQPVAMAKARVLEIGGASGGNLLPFALRYPESTCLGIDLSARQIEDGKAFAAPLAADNFQLRVEDLMDFEAPAGSFDYILCHGVFSWVPPPVQQRILQLCKHLLSPRGIACISYNTYPGWHFWEVSRHVMNRFSTSTPDEASAVPEALSLLEQFAACTQNTADLPLGAALLTRVQSLRAAPMYYTRHEYLEPCNQAFYFRDFVSLAAQQGLSYLSDADFSLQFPENITAQTPAAAALLQKVGTDRFAMEEALDVLAARTFRMSLLIQPENRINLNLDALRLAPLHVLSPFEEVGQQGADVKFQHRAREGAHVTTDDPAQIAVLRALQKHSPEPVEVVRLVQDLMPQLGHSAVPDDATLMAALQSTCGLLMQLVMAGWLDILDDAVPVSREAGPRPCTTALVRAQLKTGASHVTTLLHHSQKIAPGAAAVLQDCDGKHERSALVRRVSQAIADGRLQVSGDARPAAQLAQDLRTCQQVLEVLLSEFVAMGLLSASAEQRA